MKKLWLLLTILGIAVVFITSLWLLHNSQSENSGVPFSMHLIKDPNGKDPDSLGCGCPGQDGQAPKDAGPYDSDWP